MAFITILVKIMLLIFVAFVAWMTILFGYGFWKESELRKDLQKRNRRAE